MTVKARSKGYLALSCFLVLFCFNDALSAELNQIPPIDPSKNIHLPEDLTMEDLLNRPAHSEGKDRLCSHAAKALQATQAAGVPKAYSMALDMQSQADVTHCFLILRIDPAAKTLDGSNTLTVTSMVDGLNSFTVDLRSNMNVIRVKVNDVLAVYTRDTHKINITLDRAYNTGETFDVKVRYSGTPQVRDFGSFQWSTHNGHHAFASASSPWNAHTWWPCVESVKNRFTMDMWLTVPNDMVMASNGLLQGVDTVSATQVKFHWKVYNPIISSLVSMACTNYSMWTEYYNYPGGSMPVEFYSYPEKLSEMQEDVADVITMLETFSDPNVFGQYPFITEKYGIAQWNLHAGLEHQTMTSQGFFDEWLNAHELAHQWWGDMIACKTWNDIWLSEGFATFAEALYKEKKPGGSYDDYIGHMYRNLPGFDGTWNSKLDCSGSVYVYDASSVYNIFDLKNVYQKGAWVLHMLRWVVGDEVFFDILAAYRAAYEGSYASTDDFIGICETVYGEDLGWFFDQWVYGTGAPSYRTGWEQYPDGDNYKVKLHIEQFQTDDPLFRMPLEVEVVTASGIEKHVVWQDQEMQWYVLDADGTVEDVRVEWQWHTLQYSMDRIAYVEPLQIVSVNPAAGSNTEPDIMIDTIEVQFNRAVDCDESNFSIFGSQSGTKAFSISNSGITVTLHLSEPLESAQEWTVTVSDNITCQQWNKNLDGEMDLPSNFSSTPSGNGLPGGQAVFTFTNTLNGDLNIDQTVDTTDLSQVADQWLYHGSSERHISPLNHWAFDEGEGYYLNDSAHGTLAITRMMDEETCWVTGHNSYALKFDGIDDYVMAAYSYKGITGSSPRTCAAWVKTSTTGTIIGWGPRGLGARWIAVLDSDGYLRIEVGGGAIVGSTVVADGRWHHVAATSDGGNVADIVLYVDGNQDTPGSAGDRAIDTQPEGDVTIGGSSIFGAYFNGLIDDVRIYDRALTAEQIRQLYNDEQLIESICENKSQADTNNDCIINIDDLAIIASNWLQEL